MFRSTAGILSMRQFSACLAMTASISSSRARVPFTSSRAWSNEAADPWASGRVEVSLP